MFFGIGSVYNKDNKFRKIAEALIPIKGSGFAYAGYDLEKKLNLHDMNSYLYIRWGKHYMRADIWGYVRFSMSVKDDKSSFFIDKNFYTRSGAVLALAKSLKEVDKIIGTKKSGYIELQSFIKQL